MHPRPTPISTRGIWFALLLLVLTGHVNGHGSARAAGPDEFRIRYFGGSVGREDGRRSGKIVKVDFSATGVKINAQVIQSLRDCTELKELNVDGKFVSNELLDAIKNMKQLEVLSLPSGMEDEDLRVIEGLTELRELNLMEVGYGKGVTDEGLKSLSRLLKLKKLKLWTNKVGDPGLAEIAKLKSLTDLNLDYTKITDAGMPLLAKLPQLERLSLFQTEVTPAGMRHLKPLTKLKRIGIGGDPAAVEKSLTDIGLADAFPKPPDPLRPNAANSEGIDRFEIQTLRTKWERIEFRRDSIIIDGSGPDIFGAYFDDDELKEFAPLTGLKELTITSAPFVKGKGLAHLSACKELQKLHLDDRYLTKQVLEYMAPIPGLKLLEGQAIDSAAIATLKDFKALDELRIVNNSNFDDKFLEQFEKVGKFHCLVATADYHGDFYSPRVLTTRPGLDLHRTSITDTGMAKFAGNERIEWVRLSAAQLTERGAKTLQSLPNLVNVFAAKTEIQDAVAQQLAGVRFLESIGGKMSPTAIRHLAECKSLRILELNEASDECLAEVARQERLAILRIDGPALTDVGLRELKALKGLLYLQLTFADKVTGNAVRELGDALPNCEIRRF